jgi:DNA-binding IclR family transcriptional regulator
MSLPLRKESSRSSTRRPAAARTPAANGKEGAGRGAHPWGTQSVHRAISILRELATRGQSGLRLVDIAAAMDLERPTAHRIVKGLMAHGMIMQDDASKRYRLGHLVYELGLAAAPHFTLRELCQPVLQRLAERTGDSAFLVVRSGQDVVCIDRVEGGFPIKARTLDIGVRRPLGVGAAGLALLMSLPEPEIEPVIELNAPRFGSFGRLTAERLRHAIAASRKAGYSINDEDVLEGVAAIGAAIQPRDGPPYAAVSIAGIASRLSGPRRAEVAQFMLKEVRALEKKLAARDSAWG